jgi:hypothetical protein
MELDEVIDMINKARPQLHEYGCTDLMIDLYLDNLEDGFEPEAYKNITVMELAEDIQIAYGHGLEGYED